MSPLSNQKNQEWKHSLCAFCERTGCAFMNFSLLEQAFTHASWANEKAEKSNERLEFLGDALLEQAVSLHLYRSFPEDHEGQLTKRRTSLVCEASLAAMGRTLGLHDLLRVGPSFHGEITDAMVADAFEALVAALYLDGGLEALSCVLEPLFVSSAQRLDGKTLFIEECRLHGYVWHFQKLSKEGPDHKPLFTVTLVMGSQVFEGSGRTRRAAEQVACSAALQYLEENASAIGCDKPQALV